MYLSWNEKIITDFSQEHTNSLYNEGYVFTRKEKGVMNQTRSVRIDLSKFELTSENRRILKKTEGIELQAIPLPYSMYTWKIGKLAKDFYDTKFGEGTFSANKIKEILTDPKESNFNTLFTYYLNTDILGYSVCFETPEMVHYSYPFYDLSKSPKDMGLGMMTRAVVHAKEQGKKYIYLGSAQRPSDTYKFQFEGIEWFDGKQWNTDKEKVKDVLSQV